MAVFRRREVPGAIWRPAPGVRAWFV